MLATAHVFFQVGSHRRRDFVVDHVVEHGEKLSARHFSTPTAADPVLRLK